VPRTYSYLIPLHHQNIANTPRALIRNTLRLKLLPAE